jgi:hypothetical protein
MKAVLMCAMLASALMLASGAADAKGCIAGAIAGGVAAHMAGHSRLMGAVAGCVTAHYAHKAVRYRAERQRAQEPRQVSRQTPGAPAYRPAPGY